MTAKKFFHKYDYLLNRYSIHEEEDGHFLQIFIDKSLISLPFMEDEENFQFKDIKEPLEYMLLKINDSRSKKGLPTFYYREDLVENHTEIIEDCSSLPVFTEREEVEEGEKSSSTSTIIGLSILVIMNE